ncbi:MAG: S8 family serine peptidase, partial [Alphaproteobacteria bacterium]|nr:S8 family serine peptidase [Alphaproteobacteria bacterium]
KPYRGNVGGLLPGATLFAANIFERRKDGKPRGNLLAFLKAINWLAKSKVGVVNLSLSGAKNKVLTTVASQSIRNGMILVAAVGNAGPGAKPAYPAAYNQVVSVTALDGRKKIYRHANRGRYVDFAAPGVAIWTAGKDGGKLQSGTSFAVPFITSLTALLIHGGFKTDPDAIRGRLRRYVQDLGKPGKDNDYGLGMVRVRAPC